MKKQLGILIILIFSGSFLLAQTPSAERAELEKEKKAIQDELKEIQKVYDNIKGQTKQSLSQLNIVNRKIALQERFISNINKELRLLDDEIYLNNLEIYRLQRQLDTLKAEYAKSVVYAYKNRSSFDYVNFIFSASSFNDAMRRVAYLKSYRAYRERQVSTIEETQALIEKRKEQQLARKEQKNEALKSQAGEREELAGQRKEKSAVVARFRSQENDLKKQIAAKKKRDRDIQNAIAAIIRREIEAAKKEEARKEAARKAEAEKNKTTETAANNSESANKTAAAAASPPKKPASYLELNAGDVKLGADFSDNRGKLPWPVDNGFVKVPFGRFTIEGTDIVGDNPGVSIGTQVGATVKSVFDGEVTNIHNYGDGAAVVIRHGKYFTAYSNLTSVNVSKGQRVSRGQTIGRAGASDDGSSGLVDFMLMIESNNVNPAGWLRR
ncbi:MAG: murein hydrolase activator EnvC family protein [Chitinophagaceae bacterium]